MPVIGAPQIRDTFALSYSKAALVLLVLPEICSFVLEPPLFVLSDRIGKRRLVIGGLFALGAAFFAAGVSPNVILFSAALILIFPASGLGVGLAQAALIDAYPKQRERVMVRWTLLGSIGDAISPLFLAAIAALGGGWRWSFAAAGALFAIQAVLVSRARWRAPLGKNGAEEEREPRFFELIKEGAGNKQLWLWSIAVSFCGLLDETFVAFAALYLADDLGASAVAIDVVITACGIGGICGLLAVERLFLKAPPLRTLFLASLGTIASFFFWLWSPSIVLSTAAMFLLGAFVAPLYPIAAAKAYDASPGRAGTVAAMTTLFSPIQLGFPLIGGFIADQFGLTTALYTLLAQPVVLAIMALVHGRTRSRSSAHGAGVP